jgi:ATP-dependent helicase/nuclease subunit B
MQALAKGLLARLPDPLELTSAWVLLPNRRACRSLREAFLKVRDGQAMLLPRMLPLGELDADELGLVTGEALLPALPPVRRLLLLTMLIQRHRPLPIGEATQLALALAKLMDEAETQGVRLSDFDRLSPESLSAHWGVTLDFLKPVQAGWPAVLAAEGAMDSTARRNRLLAAQATEWEKSPPAYPVIIAGSTSVLPCITRLMKVVKGLPAGMLVLPGLPAWPDIQEHWPHIAAPHPLAEIKELLEILEVEAETITPWGKSISSPWLQVLRPAKSKASPVSMPNLAMVNAASPEEEATVIALAMRQVLDTAGTGRLVTPDRNLARRVSEIMRRWGVVVDDSAGRSLAHSAAAVFLLLIVNWVRDPRPTTLLALIKHPLLEALDNAHSYELAVLRQRTPDLSHETISWVEQVKTKISSLSIMQNTTLSQWVRQHLAVAENLVGDRLWQGEVGEALANYFAALMEAGGDFTLGNIEDYADFLVVLLGQQMVRPSYGSHPRLSIMGPLEAELEYADVTLLGGLNEGTWPAVAAPDPWLSRPMRLELGLETPERHLGREAHDFLQLASGAEVILTRSLKVGGVPTLPSRWWQRLEATLDDDGPRLRGQRWLHRASQLDAALFWQAVKQPRPCPPLAARPVALSVTQIETLRRDPYALYAQKILKLNKLEDLEPEADFAERGNFLHKVLERFLKEEPSGDVDDLMRIADEVFRASGWEQSDHTLWWPRLTLLAQKFVDLQQELDRTPAALELRGETKITADFTLSAKVDRIDRAADGSLIVLDYKTGTVPSKPDQVRGFSPQLPLTGLIVENGGYHQLGKSNVSALEYWIIGQKGLVERKEFATEASIAIQEAKEGLLKLIFLYQNARMPYVARPMASVALKYNDYALLERLKEWSVVGDDDEGVADGEAA